MRSVPDTIANLQIILIGEINSKGGAQYGQCNKGIKRDGESTWTFMSFFIVMDSFFLFSIESNEYYIIAVIHPN